MANKIPVGLLAAVMMMPLMLAGCGFVYNDAPALAPETAALDLPPIFSSRSAAIADPQSHIDAADWTKARRLSVVMVDYAFAPREIVLRAGQPYRLRIRNLGDRRHIFSAPDFFRAVAVQSAEPRGADSPAANPDSADPSTYTGITGLEVAYLPVAAAERLRRPRLFAEPDADSAESEVDTMADTQWRTHPKRSHSLPSNDHCRR